MPFTFPTPWQPPQDPGQAFRESCTMQAIVSGVVGGGAGMVLGVVLTPFNSTLQAETEHLELREQMRRGVREMGVQSRSWGKSLLVIGAVFSASECFVEKSRGRTDRWNSILGGCLTGGVLAANAGPQAMGIGCVGFAAFSAAIDALGFGHFD
eukprot:scaffold315403_cov31-Tisochrysis_lutea.AAC.4